MKQKKKAELKSGVVLKHSKTTVAEYLDKWLKVAAKPRLRERTYEDYIQYLNRYTRPKIGKIQLSKLKPLDIQAVYTWMLEKGLSARTVRFAHAIVSSALKQAVKWQILLINPATLVDLPQIQRKEMMTLSPDEAAHFLDIAKQDNWGCNGKVLTLRKERQPFSVFWSGVARAAVGLSKSRRPLKVVGQFRCLNRFWQS